MFYEKRATLKAVRQQIPEMEEQLSRLIENGASADDIRSAQHGLDLHKFQLRKLEVFSARIRGVRLHRTQLSVRPPGHVPRLPPAS